MEVTTERTVAGGDALAHAPDGRVVLVEGALPGERVRVEITSDRADVILARVADVLDASDSRIEPPCVYARSGCGGCSWQHVAIAAQPQLKREIIVDALRRTAHLDNPPLTDTITLPDRGYRSTIRALVVDGRPAFRRHHAHDPVMFDTCMVAHPLVDELLQAGRFDGAHEVTIRAGVHTGERSVLADPADVRVTVPDDVAQGPSAHIHELVEGRRFRISTRSFFQSRADGAATLARLVREAVGPDRVVADLYCGVGILGALLDRPRRILAVENSRSAVADAKVNLRGLSAHVVRSDVAKIRPVPVDVVIADPSRAGLGRAAVKTIVACDPDRIVLVSCDVAALARDVALLRDEHFELTQMTPVDMFPHTPHIECVSVLDAERR